MNAYIKIKNFFESRLFIALSVLAAACFVILDQDVYGAIALVNLGAVALLFCDNVISAFTPALLACTFVIKCYDSADIFLPLWWTALFPVAAIAVYLIVYRKKITVGKSFKGLMAVSVAVTLGGLFTISPTDYFSGASLYYVIMLGFGMVAAYLLVRSHINETTRYNVFERFVEIMTVVGLFACFVIFEHYAWTFKENLLIGELADIQWSNNISTIIMYAMPFMLWYARKRLILLPLLLLNYGALVLAGSRGGFLMGTVEVVICLVIFCFISEQGKVKSILFSLFCIAVTAAVCVVVLKLTGGVDMDKTIVSHGEARVRMIARSFEDFSSNPLFGMGIGNRGNTDVYDGKKGTMIWYHMMVPQVVGSLGLVGMFCYVKQIKDRFRMAFAKRDAYVWILGLSYVGMLLMSQVNPGEFCPLPYELLVVTNFIMIERYQEKGACQKGKLLKILPFNLEIL